ncbi:peptidoglycan bridge formation glycyltransferase FemA/FemB family protein [Candidatus Uhrbacteria bacterium]|nr:peptidoglycan bridge formation glycyltransferase FemA/FemB family protein [Candidatus Uhrbacteria bacterium]
MKLVEITAQKMWDSFVSSQPYAQFTQSWTWGEFRKQQGCVVRRFVVMDAIGDWRAAIQLEKRQRHFGLCYWFAPRGPIFYAKAGLAERKEIFFFVLEQLQKHPDIKTKSVFLRFEPLIPYSDELRKSFSKKLGWHASMNPANSALLDLTQAETVLQSSMHAKTRYNIRLSEKHGITVRTSNNKNDLQAFLDLYAETGKRDGFVPQSRKYVQKTFETCSAANMATLRLAEKKGKILSANIEISYGDTVMYLYGSSSEVSREVMAPYALHWNAICDAKEKGYHFYDFGGTNPSDKNSVEYRSSWEGISRFKTNWGAVPWEFIGTWDHAQQPILYFILNLKKAFR